MIPSTRMKELKTTGTFEVKLSQSSLMSKIVCGRKDCWQGDSNPQTLFDTLIAKCSEATNLDDGSLILS